MGVAHPQHGPYLPPLTKDQRPAGPFHCVLWGPLSMGHGVAVSSSLTGAGRLAGGGGAVPGAPRLQLGTLQTPPAPLLFLLSRCPVNSQAATVVRVTTCFPFLATGGGQPRGPTWCHACSAPAQFTPWALHRACFHLHVSWLDSWAQPLWLRGNPQKQQFL